MHLLFLIKVYFFLRRIILRHIRLMVQSLASTLDFTYLYKITALIHWYDYILIQNNKDKREYRYDYSSRLCNLEQ